ncbi:MAG: four helix bundle protein [Hymenobacter sp.]|nr:four helix bundle protein [Hymenobacter sp.]
MRLDRGDDLLTEVEEGAENVVAYKSFALAVRAVRLCRHLRETKQEYVLSEQLLRSGTSVGANVEEGIGGISRADFSARISIAIAHKESRETSYWLRLLHATGYLSPEAFASIHHDSEELCRILRAILNTTRGMRNEELGTRNEWTTCQNNSSFFILHSQFLIQNSQFLHSKKCPSASSSTKCIPACPTICGQLG